MLLSILCKTLYNKSVNSFITTATTISSGHMHVETEISLWDWFSFLLPALSEFKDPIQVGSQASVPGFGDRSFTFEPSHQLQYLLIYLFKFFGTGFLCDEWPWLSWNSDL